MRISGWGTSGRIRIFCNRATMVLLSASLTGACSAEPRMYKAGEYMLDQASGVQLGMPWREVHRLRPAAFVDSYSVRESVMPTTENVYYFGDGAGIEPGATLGTLKAVVMEKSLSVVDSAEYNKAVQTVADRWSTITHREPEVFHRTLGGPSGFPPLKVRVLRWRSGSIVLLLVHGAEPNATDSRSTLFRAIVQCSGVSLPETQGLRLSEPSSPSG